MSNISSSKPPFFASIINDLSFIVTFLGIAIGITKFIIELGKVNLNNSIFLMGLLLLFLIWIISSIMRANKSFVSPRKLPFPSSLWRLVFNNIPVEHLTDLKSDRKAGVLIIYDNSTKEKLESIKEKYNDDSLEITHISIEEIKEWKENQTGKKNSEKKKNLSFELKKCDALLFFWTMDFKKESWLHSYIEEWALTNSHKAILAVNMMPDSVYYLNYNTIPKSDYDSSLWRLLSRATERGRLWRSQANSFRRIAISFALVLFFVFLFVGFKYETIEVEKKHYYAVEETLDNKIKEITDKLNMNDVKFNNELWSLMANYRRDLGKEIENYFKEEKKKIIQLIEEKFSEYSINAFNALNVDLRFDPRKMSVSFWFATKYKENESSEEFKTSKILKFSVETDTHDFDMDSIIGCSFSCENSFVFWKKEGKNLGDKACLKNDFGKSVKKLELTGKWITQKENGLDVWKIECKDPNNNIVFGQYKKLDNEPPERQGLLCLSINDLNRSTVDESKKIMRGVCIDSHLKPDFFDKKEILIFMRKAACIMQIIPQDIIEEILDRDGNYKNSKVAPIVKTKNNKS